jgi:hypothetical protein
MKKLTVLATLTLAALLFTSCQKVDYKSFVGTWGVEKIEYYNIDYAGHPIESTIQTYKYDPDSEDNGIRLIFREDKTGEIRDAAIDTIWTDWNETTEQYETCIPCPDTVLVTRFTCSYDESDKALYMTVETDSTVYTSRTFVTELTNNSFVYENEYDKNYVEKAYLKRISKTPSKSASRQSVSHPHKKRGSIFGSK